MARRGRKRQLDVEAQYWALLANGIGTVEACRILGIGRKTGYRWRAETGGLVPGRLPEVGRSSRFLSLLDRQRIATLRRGGCTMRDIARRLGRAPSTISRELRRNTARHDRDYDGDLTHSRARQRARRLRRTRIALDGPAASDGAVAARAGVEPRADRRPPAHCPPRPAVVARLPRNDLPGALPRREKAG